MKKVFGLLILFVCMISLSSCEGLERISNPLIGTWDCIYESNGYYTNNYEIGDCYWVFYEESVLVHHKEEQMFDDVNIGYTLGENNTITIWGRVQYTYTVTKNELTLEGDYVYRFTKAKKNK